MGSQPFYFESISMLRSALNDGFVTYRGIVEHCIAAYLRFEPYVRAWVVFDAEGALNEADRLDEERLSGKPVTPLHGIPIGVKDIIDVQGMPTRAGTERWSNEPARKDAPMVARLREQGAIILGKTVTTAYAWVDPPVTRNPWDTDRTPGGSSSGSAVAVTTGMAVAAIGTQTGGSVIRPASFCGVIGWKPAFSRRASTEGIVPFSASLDTPGWFVRDVTDIVTLQPASGGQLTAARDPIWTMARVDHYLSREAGGGFDDETRRENVEELEARPGTRLAPRLGRLRGFLEEKTHPSMLEAVDAAAIRWAAAGADVVDVKFPAEFAGIHKAHRIVMAHEAAVVHAERFARVPGDYPPRISELLREGAKYGEAEYRDALRMGAAFSRFVRPDLDAIILPAAPGPAPGPETTGDPAFNSPWTFGGQPVITFPIGFSSGDRMPLGIQFVGRDGGDSDLLTAAEWCRWDKESRSVLPGDK